MTRYNIKIEGVFESFKPVDHDIIDSCLKFCSQEKIKETTITVVETKSVSLNDKKMFARCLTCQASKTFDFNNIRHNLFKTPNENEFILVCDSCKENSKK